MYSEVKAMAFGIAPPMPSPVNTRNAISASTDCAVAVNSDPTPKISADTTRTGFRPTRSATGPLSQRADHHPDEASGDHRAEDASRDVQSRRQGRGHISHGLGIEPVDGDDEPAHHRRQQLVAADRTVVDEFADVENTG